MKKYLSILLIIAFIFSLCACGATKETNKDESKSSSVSTQKETESIIETEAKTKIIELNNNSEIEKENEYKFYFELGEILTDSAKADGWFYYYTDNTEKKTPYKEWVTEEGKYTDGEFNIMITNLKDKMEKPFVEQVKTIGIFSKDQDIDPEKLLESKDYQKELEDKGAEIINVIPLQTNPGQTDEDGYDIESTKGVLIDKDQEIRMMFRFSVSKELYDSWLDKNSTDFIHAYFTFGYDIYDIDIRKNVMEPDID